MNALKRAFSEVDRMRSAVAVKAPDASGMLTSGVPGGIVRPSIGSAQEQLLAFKGWTYAAISLVAQRIAGQRICVARKAKGPKRGKASSIYDGLEPLDSHPLLDVLHDPNALSVAWSLMFVTVVSLEATGRTLWWRTNDNGRDSLLHIPTPWIRETDAKRTMWKIRPDGATQDFVIPGDEVCYFFYPDPANPLGALSPLQKLAESIVADDEIARAQWVAFKNGIFPKVVLTAGRLPDGPDGTRGERPVLTPEQRNDLISAIKQVYQGSHNYDQPFILDGLIENITKLSSTIAEMDFLDSSKLTKSKILQGFRVSPILLGEIEGANRASATVADEIFVANKVNPLITLLSQTMTAWLGPMFAGPREKLVVWIEPAVAHDPDLQQKRWEFAATRGFVSQNEYRRAILNLPDVDGGDEFLIPALMLPRS